MHKPDDHKKVEELAPREQMAEDLGTIDDPTVRSHVQHVYESVLKSRNGDGKDVNNQALEEANLEKKLDGFLDSAKKPYNLLYIDPNISKPALEERMVLLGILYRAFKSASLKDRSRLEPVISKMFGIPQMPDDISDYLEALHSHPDTKLSAGAENVNMIFNNSAGLKQVIKQTKNRHETDFSSVLKLMYDMHAIALRFNHEPVSENKDDNNVEINLSFKDMVVFKDRDGKYRRMVRQNFAGGRSIKDLPQNIKEEDPNFRAAWKVFLRKVDAMKKSDGIVLDISDSAAGFKKERGNVANTGNVFVEFPDANNPKYRFVVIDPDVFDTDKGEHKFDPKEYLRAGKKTGMLKGFIAAAGMAATNAARENVVRPWQDSFVKKELEN
jgi:hypothetical protein